MIELVGIINIGINPVLIDTGGFELTWHGLFTAIGIALGVWLAVRLARPAKISEDDAMSIAVVSVLSGIIGARLLWVLEHTDQIGSVGDVFALTDGGISIYGAMIGGVLGGFVYVTLFKPNFPKWVALDVAAPGMILGQAIGRFGDFVNGEHFANASELPWAFRYTHPFTDGPWSAPGVDGWFRGSRGFDGEMPWVLEHTDQIGSVGDVFALTDGGISIYGAMIGGVLGGFVYVTLFKPNFPKWVALDVAAPGMILGQAIGRFGDFVNGEHFANASELPWAFRYTHPFTDGPWSAPGVDGWFRGSRGFDGEMPVAVHPVAGGYEPILDLMILGGLFLLRRTGVGAGWGFTFYVFAYAVVRGSLSLLRTDEAAFAGTLSVPQLLAIVTAAAAVWMALHLLRHRQPAVLTGGELQRHTHRGSRRGGLGRG